MRKAITNTWSLYLLLMLATSIYGCERCGSSSKGNTSPPQTPTQIEYSINLDDSKKMKEEGNKIYYEVPLQTEVSIVAKTTGLLTVDIDWNQSPSHPLGRKMSISKRYYNHHESTRNGRVIAGDSAGEMESAWVFASITPICVTVSGNPHRIGQAHEQGNNMINNEKIFVITWK
jgi:hypothetical protein